MTDQFEFDPEDVLGEGPDPTESEPAFSDRLDESRDEGYLPPASWDEPVPAPEESTPAAEEFEPRQQQEQPEIVDDWDEGRRAEGSPDDRSPAA